MFYLINQLQSNHMLLDYGPEIFPLQQTMIQEKEKRAGLTPVILNQRVVRETYLCNDFGIPIVDDGSLIRLDDL